MVRRRHECRQLTWRSRSDRMKSPLTLSIAALAILACSDSTSPTSNLSSTDAKQTDPPFSVSGTLTNTMYTFDDGTFSSSDGGAFTVESTAGGFGASAP